MTAQHTLPAALEEWQQWAAEHPQHDNPRMVPVVCDEPLVDDLTAVCRLAQGLTDELHRHRRDHPATPTAQHLAALIGDVAGRIPDRVSQLWD